MRSYLDLDNIRIDYNFGQKILTEKFCAILILFLIHESGSETLLFSTSQFYFLVGSTKIKRRVLLDPNPNKD